MPPVPHGHRARSVLAIDSSGLLDCNLNSICVFSSKVAFFCTFPTRAVGRSWGSCLKLSSAWICKNQYRKSCFYLITALFKLGPSPLPPKARHWPLLISEKERKIPAQVYSLILDFCISKVSKHYFCPLACGMRCSSTHEADTCEAAAGLWFFPPTIFSLDLGGSPSECCSFVIGAFSSGERWGGSGRAASWSVTVTAHQEQPLDVASSVKSVVVAILRLTPLHLKLTRTPEGYCLRCIY